MDWAIPYVKAGAILAEVVLLVWIAKKILSLILRRDLDNDLTSLDNPALSVALSGYLLAIFVALSALLLGEPGRLKDDLLNTACYGAIAIFCLLFSMIGWPAFLGISLRRDLFDGRNVGSGLCAMSSFLATSFVFRGSLSGEGGGLIHILVFFILGQGALFLTALVYQWITPYDIYAEIAGKNNLAAAVGFSGALFAMGLIAGHAAAGDFLSWEESIKDFGITAAPLLLFWPVRWIVVNGLMLNGANVDREIVRDRNVGAGVVEAVSYIGMSLFYIHLV